MSLTLYSHPLASYCHKVLIALYEHGLDFEQRVIDLGKAADRAELAALWPLGKFPVLRDHLHGRDIPESSIIIEYLDHFDSANTPLIPADWEQALQVRLWDRFFDNHVQGPMQAIVANRLGGGDSAMAGERAALATAYAMIDAQAAAGGWIAGEQFSMADCAAAPALFYAITLEPIPAEATHANAYFERLMARPSVRRVIDEARPFFSMYPFVAGMAARFRDGA